MLSHALRASLIQTKRVSFIDSATNAASTVVIPATAQVGDIAFLFNNGNNTTNTTIPPLTNEPAGWTKIATVDSSNTTATECFRVKYYLKILTSGEPGSTVTAASGTTSTRLSVLIFRPSFNVSTITTTTPTTFGSVNVTSINQTQTINVTPLTAPTVLIAHACNFTGVSGFTTTPAPTGIITPSGGNPIRYLIQNVLKANITTTYNQTGTNLSALVSFGMSFS
jgi:hypothetical protein